MNLKTVDKEDVTNKLLYLTEYKTIANKLDSEDLFNLSLIIGMEREFLENGGYYNIWENIIKEEAKDEFRKENQENDFDDFLKDFVGYYFVDKEIPVYRVKINDKDNFSSVKNSTIYNGYLYFTDYIFKK